MFQNTRRALANRQRLVAIISECLHEPRARAASLADGALRNERLWRRDTQRMLDRLHRGERHGVVVAPHERRRLDAFAAYLEAERAPLVLLGFHFGNFVLDLVKLLDAATIGTRVFAPVPARSLAALRPLAVYAAATGKELKLLPIKSNLALALRRARARDVVLLLCDLGARYGQTTTASWFGVPVGVVAGPYSLARLLEATIVFHLAERTKAGSELEFDTPNDACCTPEPPGVSALAAQYVRRMERAIVSQPTFWGRWAEFPELISAGPAKVTQATDVVQAAGAR